MMADNPAPLSSTITKSTDVTPWQSLGGPDIRDDDASNWPQNYTMKELEFNYSLPNPYDSSAPINRRIHGYLSVPTTPPPPSGFPAVVAVTGHGGSAWMVMNPAAPEADPGYWYGDSFARRGFIVLAVDVSHRPAADRRGLYVLNPERGADEAHGNFLIPSIKPSGFDSDWEEDGERVWDVMQMITYLLSRSDVDGSRLLVTGLSMGGEVAAIASALDPRVTMSIPAGYSPDMGVMMNYVNGTTGRNHECWQWLNADIREYVDISDFFALTAPRPLVIETGRRDTTFSSFSAPFASDKQVARRTRVAYGGEIDNFVHYLHDSQHAFRVGDVGAVQRERFVRVPNLTGPVTPHDFNWQLDGGTSVRAPSLYDLINSFFPGTSPQALMKSPATLSAAGRH
jgi:dienelactone hydrolase